MNLEASARPEKRPQYTSGVVFAGLALYSVFLVLFWLHDWMALLCYLIFVGGFQAVVTLIVASIIFGVCGFLPAKNIFVRGIMPFFLFNFWLLLFGLIGDFAWLFFAENKLYINHDPVVEWIPFIIPGDWTIDPVCNGSLTPGTTWGQMYLTWLLIALPVWGLTIAAYRWTKPRLLIEPVRSRVQTMVAVLCITAAMLGAFIFCKAAFT